MSVYIPYIIDLPMVLNEAYFGKSDLMREMEDVIGDIRSRYKSMKDMDADQSVVRFNRLMEKQFGMNVFTLHIDHQNIKNAYTFPISTRFDIAFSNGLKNKVEKNNKTGFRFKEGNCFCIYCCIYAGLLTDKNITNGEILAIILHEVGHNFADAVNNDIRIYNRDNIQAYHNYIVTTMYLLICISVYYGIIAVVGGTPAVIALGVAAAGSVTAKISKDQQINNNTNKQTTKDAKSREKKNIFRGFGDAVSSKFKDFGMFMVELSSRLSFGGFNKITSLLLSNADIKPAGKQEAKQNEMVADKFATINGYGIEIHSALEKMIGERSAAEKAVDTLPIIGAMMNKSYDNMVDVFMRFDEHPKASQRIRTSIEALEFELNNKKCDPKLKAELQAQVKQLKAMEENAVKKWLEKTTDPKFNKDGFNKFMKSKEVYAIDKKTEDKINKEIDEFIKF